MKVLLVNPPRLKGTPVVREVRCAGMSPVSVYPPLRLLYVAGFLRKKKIDVSLIDANGEDLGYEQLKRMIKKEMPEVLIFTSSPTTMTYDCQTAKIAKEVDKKILTVLDDSHIAPCFPEKVLRRFPFIDVLIRGNSEEAAYGIAKNIKDLRKVNGISFRKNNEIVSKGRGKVFNINYEYLPLYELVNLDNYYSWTFGKEKRLVTLLTSVSCPFKCSFCIIGGATVWRGYGKRWLAKSKDRVLKEIEYLYSDFGVKNFYFFDETFTIDKKRGREICQGIIERKIGINWSCNSRVDTVDKEILKWMSKSGCWNICFGLESGSQKVLDSVNKKTDLDQANKIFETCRKLGIKSSASFMIGLPEDSKETLRQTLEFAKRLNPDRVQFVITTAYPGTKLYDLVKKEKLLEKDYDFSGFDAYGINNEAVLKSKYLSAKEISGYAKKMYLGFYLRPGQIIKLVKGIKDKNDLISLFKMAGSL